jgi:hypothetical protein
MESAEKSSLYDRLGGVHSIATVVDDLIDRVMADPRLNANPLVDERTTACPRLGSSTWLRAQRYRRKLYCRSGGWRWESQPGRDRPEDCG